MAYPDDPAPDPLVWFKNIFQTAATIKANITDQFNALRALPRGYLGRANDGSNTTTLAVTGTVYAGFAPVTVTVPGAVGSGNRAIRASTQCRIIQTSTTNVQYSVQAGYNTGASIVIGSFVGMDLAYNATTAVSGINGQIGISTEGIAILAAGTQITCYAAITRVANGSATDAAGRFHVDVEDLGAA